MLRYPLLLGAQGIRMAPWTTARSGGDCETAAACRTMADMAGHLLVRRDDGTAACRTMADMAGHL